MDKTFEDIERESQAQLDDMGYSEPMSLADFSYTKKKKLEKTPIELEKPEGETEAEKKLNSLSETDRKTVIRLFELAKRDDPTLTWDSEYGKALLDFYYKSSPTAEITNKQPNTYGKFEGDPDSDSPMALQMLKASEDKKRTDEILKDAHSLPEYEGDPDSDMPMALQMLKSYDKTRK